MFKKILYFWIAIFSNLLVVSANTPTINCTGLPWCWKKWNNDVNVIEKVWANIISEMIKYVAVLAVITLMISWIMYMLSGWEEEKTKKAKSWIIWSLVWVVLSISSFYLISTIAEIKINL